MPYCSRCGVEVDETVNDCPLCKAPIQKLPTEDDPGHPYPKTASPIPPGTPLSFKDRIRLARIITSFGILIPFFIILAVDIYLNRSITWSAFVLSSLGLIWVCSILPLFMHKRPFILIGGIFLAVSGFLWFLDYYTGRRVWFFSIGLPSAFAAAILAVVVVLILRRKSRSGLHIAAWIVLSVTILAVIIDLLLSRFLSNALHFSWSLIVVGAFLPVAGLLFYLDSVAGRRSKLRRIFHI